MEMKATRMLRSVSRRQRMPEFRPRRATLETMSHPYVPHPVPPHPAPMATVDLNIQGSLMTGLPPTVHVNGHRVTVHHGAQSIAVPAGPVRIDVYSQWLRRYGEASLEFFLQPGQRAPVWYGAPYHQFTAGSIGHTQQPRKGLALAILLPLAIAVGIAVALIALAFLL